jgi:hypothetical protein
MKAEGKTIELDENENIKGWDELLSGLKTQLPGQFEKSGKGGYEPNPLPEGHPTEPAPQNLAEALREHYEQK